MFLFRAPFRSLLRRSPLVWVLALVAALSSAALPVSSARAGQASIAAQDQAAVDQAAMAEAPVEQAPAAPAIVVLGDSLSAGYGMTLDEAWPSLLQRRLEDNGQRYRVVNASISGETTQGGRTRLPRLLERHEPAWVIIELGGNDGLRGFSLQVTRDNLAAMMAMSREAGAKVLLAGIMLPPNYGAAYADRFAALYSDLAAANDALLLPFILEGVALDPDLMQDDGIHPNEKAQPVLLENVWSLLGPALEG
jgi:acyl-CoA thioesterase-1